MYDKKQGYFALVSGFGADAFLPSEAFEGLSPFEAAAPAAAAFVGAVSVFEVSDFVDFFFAGLAASCAKLAEPNAATATSVTNIFFILCDFGANVKQILT
jgi:hypothetical protein